MLTTYFKRQATHAIYYTGPAGPYLDEFTDWLTKRGYCHDTIRHLLPGAIGFANWVQATSGSLKSLPIGVWSTYCEHLAAQGRLRRAKHQHSVYWRAAQHFVEFLRVQHGIIAVEAPVDTTQPELVAEFERWMLAHRGVKPSTLITYHRHVIDLLSTLGECPEQFNAAKLHAFILAFAQRNACALSQTRVSSIRMFLRFLIATQRCQPGLEAAIPTIAEWRLATLPRYLPSDDVERVLTACDGTRSIDIRDKAILLLLARLGLRAGEVVDLKLGDIDWSKGTFTVIGKSRREVKLPLPQEVGDALLKYLKQGRPPVSSHYVFITAVAPWTPITQSVVKHLCAHAIQRAGVQAPSFGSHIFRHSAATKWLHQGASLQVIGEILRHRSIDTTALYAKVDIGLLQQVVRPWPGAISC